MDKNEPFYIGIGTKPKKYRSFYEEYSRAFSKQRSTFWKIIAEKSEYSVEILFESTDLKEIENKEKEFIDLYGRKDLNKGSLCNLTDGGLGMKGCKSKKRQWKGKGVLSLKQRFIRKWGKDVGELKYKERVEKLKKDYRSFWTDDNIKKAAKKRSGENHWTKRLNGKDHPCKGREKTKEELDKMRKANLGKRRSIPTEFKSKPIYQIEPKTYNVVREFEGALEASNTLKCSVSCITNAIRGYKQKGKDFHWSYKESYESKVKELKNYYLDKTEPPVIVYKEDKIIGIFKDRFEAAKVLKLHSNSILKCLTGVMNRTKNYKIKYL